MLERERKLLMSWGKLEITQMIIGTRNYLRLRNEVWFVIAFKRCFFILALEQIQVDGGILGSKSCMLKVKVPADLRVDLDHPESVELVCHQDHAELAHLLGQEVLQTWEFESLCHPLLRDVFQHLHLLNVQIIDLHHLPQFLRAHLVLRTHIRCVAVVLGACFIFFFRLIFD